MLKHCLICLRALSLSPHHHGSLFARPYDLEQVKLNRKYAAEVSQAPVICNIDQDNQATGMLSNVDKVSL